MATAVKVQRQKLRTKAVQLAQMLRATSSKFLHVFILKLRTAVIIDLLQPLKNIAKKRISPQYHQQGLKELKGWRQQQVNSSVLFSLVSQLSFPFFQVHLRHCSLVSQRAGFWCTVMVFPAQFSYFLRSTKTAAPRWSWTFRW